ncbi:MAG: Trk system potassium transporter TrkA [Clostridia bacterium]|nr:Trk system potassium transporter TrkA [Clostridia bacterium]
MNIIIAGGGRVGSTLARHLAAEGYNVTVIDVDQNVLEKCVEKYDVMAAVGNCAAMSVLGEAGVRSADLLLAVTGEDEINLLCCTTAYAMNPHLHTIARIRNPEYTDQIHEMRSVFGLSMTVNPERQAAVEIERLLKYPGFLRRDTFAKGRAEIVELRIDENSPLAGVTLAAMNGVVKCKVLVCAILRNGKAIPPKGGCKLLEGDRIFVTAPTEVLTVLLKNLGVITRRARRIIICGGGTIGYYLAKSLQKSGVSVQLVEKDPVRCEELARLLPKTQILLGDRPSGSILETDKLSDYDAFIALTGSDELNMIFSLYSASRGVPQVITKLGGTTYNQSLIDELSLGSVICPRDLCCNDIVRYVRALENQSGAALSVHSIADGQVEAVEFLVDENTRNSGIPLKDLQLRDDVLVASIIHGSTAEIPNGDSKFAVGDTVVVVTSGDEIVRQLNDIFA